MDWNRRLIASGRELVFAGLLFFSLLSANAQESGPYAAVWEMEEPPEGGWTVGAPIPLQLRVTGPAGPEMVFPELKKDWGLFEIREQQPPQTDTTGDGTIALQEISIVGWMPGDLETPPVTVRYRDSQDEWQAISPSPLTISLVSVLNEDDLEKHDLKPQAVLPRPPLWPWILGGLLLALLLFFALRWLIGRWKQRRSKVPETATAVVDDRFPEEIAYEELDRIETLDLPAGGEMKQHYTLLTDCVRRYLEGLVRVPALDRTTFELTLALRKTPVEPHLSTLRSLLDEADLVKFAKLAPTVDDARGAVGRARYLVDVTRPDRTPTQDGAHPESCDQA